uniref:Transposase n=1 Tax=Mycobacterium riyadhense TaxID=486698 RepID=A0A653EVM1_9MYCO|nr:hypothetical protein BIN_B_03725 [Mycobacterium riyadhense]
MVKTPYRIVIENLNVAGMLASHRLARAISDAGWAEFARLLKYKQAWRGGHLVEADPLVSLDPPMPALRAVNRAMTLADRVFTCAADTPPTETPTPR